MATGHRIISAQSIILDTKDVIDHINGNGLDNRKANLRIVTHNQNMYNKKIYKNNKSGIKGVVYRKDKEKYVAFINFEKCRYNLGSFETLEEARLIRQQAEIEYFCEYRRK